MASETDPIAPRTWVAIDIAKGVNVALIEHTDGRQQLLAIQRRMIQVLRDQHLSQKTGRGDTLVDDVGRHRRLDQSLTATAGPFTADVALDLEHARAVIELLADILSNALEMGAAAALGALGLMPELPARERSW